MASAIIATPKKRRTVYERHTAVQTPAQLDLAEHERAVIDAALQIIRAHWRSEGRSVFDSPTKVKEFMTLQLGCLDHEVFAVMFLDSQHRLIAFEQMFRGTLTQTSVYPREVVRRAMALNAGAVAFAHNHPSGLAEPSRADEFLTKSLKSALQMVDVRVLDHLVVGGNDVVSFAERGLL